MQYLLKIWSIYIFDREMEPSHLEGLFNYLGFFLAAQTSAGQTGPKFKIERTWFEVRGSAILGGSVGSRFGFGGQS